MLTNSTTHPVTVETTYIHIYFFIISKHLLASPLHLPVIRAPSQRLFAENLSPELESIRMVWWVQVLSPHCCLTIAI